MNGLFSASLPYCLQVHMKLVSDVSEPVQLYWRRLRKKDICLYLSAGREYQQLSDGDFTVFRLTEARWQAVVEKREKAAPENWEMQPFTLQELAVHPEFATFTVIDDDREEEKTC
ncbi:hypothetical protein [Xenorhabdus bovienii]|nr:hypothetical protein [Xenorhabdus bovienii]